MQVPSCFVEKTDWSFHRNINTCGWNVGCHISPVLGWPRAVPESVIPVHWLIVASEWTDSEMWSGRMCIYSQCQCQCQVVRMITIEAWYATLIARFMGPTWGPPGADRTQVGPMLTPWTLLSGYHSDSLQHLQWQLNSGQHDYIHVYTDAYIMSCVITLGKLTLIQAQTNNYVHYKVWYEITYPFRQIITSIIKCGMKLLIHSQTSTVQPLKFVNG